MKYEELRAELVTAMKAKDKPRKQAVSSLIAAVKNVAIDEGCRDDIREDLVDRVILKELKSIREQLDTCPAERTDLKEEYQAQFDIVSGFAPQMMSEAEVKEVLERDFAEVLATKNKGQIMKAVMPALKGKADGKVINMVVSALCQ